MSKHFLFGLLILCLLSATVARGADPIIRSGGPAKPGQQVEFRDADGNLISRKIVFVLDVEQSMPAVRHELAKAVAGLKPFQSFSIITAGKEKPTHFREQLVPATPDNKRAAFAHMDTLKGIAKSDPVPAFEAALRQGPELVYFLTDHKLPNVEALAKSRATLDPKDRAKVNTILFDALDEATAEGLKQLSEPTGGRFVYMKASELEPADPATTRPANGSAARPTSGPATRPAAKRP